jgi:hypothetical protein
MSTGTTKAVTTTMATEGPDFLATADCQENMVSARMAGTADLNVKTALDDFLLRLHQAAQAQHAAEVVMDFRGLKFMNSSCLKGLVTWICAVQELPAQNRYKIVLLSSPEMHWQRRSLAALTGLAGELVTIQS